MSLCPPLGIMCFCGRTPLACGARPLGIQRLPPGQGGALQAWRGGWLCPCLLTQEKGRYGNSVGHSNGMGSDASGKEPLGRVTRVPRDEVAKALRFLAAEAEA